MRVKLFLFLLLILASCKMGPYYWNAEICNDDRCQLRFINYIGSQPYFYLRLLTNKNSGEEHCVLLALKGNVKYCFADDSNLNIDIFIEPGNAIFRKTMRGYREDGKDWAFAYFEAVLGNSYEKRICQDTVKTIQYHIAGSIVVNSKDTLQFNSRGELKKGNWEGNWKEN